MEAAAPPPAHRPPPRPPAAPRPLDVGRVISETFSTYGRHAGVLLGSAVVIFGIIGLINGFLYDEGGILFTLIIQILNLLGTAIFTGMVVKVVQAERQGQSPRSARCSSRSARPRHPDREQHPEGDRGRHRLPPADHPGHLPGDDLGGHRPGDRRRARRRDRRVQPQLGARAGPFLAGARGLRPRLPDRVRRQPRRRRDRRRDRARRADHPHHHRQDHHGAGPRADLRDHLLRPRRRPGRRSPRRPRRRPAPPTA